MTTYLSNNPFIGTTFKQRRKLARKLILEAVPYKTVDPVTGKVNKFHFNDLGKRLCISPSVFSTAKHKKSPVKLAFFDLLDSNQIMVDRSPTGYIKNIWRVNNSTMPVPVDSVSDQPSRQEILVPTSKLDINDYTMDEAIAIMVRTVKRELTKEFQKEKQQALESLHIKYKEQLVEVQAKLYEKVKECIELQKNKTSHKNWIRSLLHGPEKDKEEVVPNINPTIETTPPAPTLEQNTEGVNISGMHIPSENRPMGTSY